MKKSFQLFLEGYGHLEGIEQKDGETLARIRIEPKSSNDDLFSDEITVYCTVEKPLLLFVIKQLEDRRVAGHSILLSFRMAYSHLGDYFRGETPEGSSDSMVVLHSRLLLIKGWFQDDDWTFPESLAWETVRSLLGAV